MSISIPTAYQANIGLPYGSLKNIIRWCRDNCIDEWGFQEVDDLAAYSPGYIFYFENERDYVAFLVWNK